MKTGEELKQKVLDWISRYWLEAVGLALLLAGLVSGSWWVIIIGILVAIGGIGRVKVLRREQVIDNWSILIEGAQGRSEEVLEGTEELIKGTEPPGISMKREEVSPGVIRGMTGERREFLVVTEADNPRLAPYQIFVNARDYGNNLDVAWYLTFRPSLWRALISFIPFVSLTNVVPTAGTDLELFDLQDLTAYTTNAHHCLLEEVEELMLDLGEDPSRIDRKSEGFLGIS